MYGKLFAQMYDGTLASVGPWQALVTFQQLIILADKRGIVDMTIDAICRKTTIPREIIEPGIARLMQADPDSRTPDEDGRRIVLISENRNWGWRLVNYKYYRNLRNEDERREYHRKYWHTRKDSTTQPDSTETQQTQPSARMQNAVSSKQNAEEDSEPRHVPPKASGPDLLPGEKVDFTGMQRNGFGTMELIPTDEMAKEGIPNPKTPEGRVFIHWQKVHKHPRAKLDAKRVKLIRGHLKRYSEQDLMDSITGYTKSEHHRGNNPSRTVYDSLELMLRDTEHIDMGLGFFGRKPTRIHEDLGFG